MAFPYSPFLPTGYFIGRQVATFGLAGLAINASDGTVTPGTQADMKLLGILEKAKFMSEVNHEEISPCTVRLENHVIISEGISLDIDEIIPVGARSNLFALMASYDYIRFVFLANSLGNASSTGIPSMGFSIDMVRGNTSIEINKGKCLATMQLKSAGVSFSGLTYV